MRGSGVHRFKFPRLVINTPQDVKEQNPEPLKSEYFLSRQWRLPDEKQTLLQKSTANRLHKLKTSA